MAYANVQKNGELSQREQLAVLTKGASQNYAKAGRWLTNWALLIPYVLFENGFGLLCIFGHFFHNLLFCMCKKGAGTTYLDKTLDEKNRRN
jgi:hypothetical protein